MSNFKKVAVLGAGAWGSSLAIILSKNTPEVFVWAREPEVVASVEKNRTNSLFLPDIKIPQNVKFTGDPKTAIENAELLVWGVPIQYLDSTAKSFSPHVLKGAIMINAGKGIEIGTWRRPSQVLKESVPNAGPCGSIMGPNIAFEVAKGNYAEAVVALDDPAAAQKAAEAFTT
ncbi:MAG: NAD(P)-binding domain-containing protein, partial [Opitutales bacterium]|nr:NAD(P)-binding domain-containing protein [Opitutales bacterium]